MGTPPAPHTPGIPAGFKMDDGYQALVTFTLNPTVSLWPMTVTPPGADGGEAIPTSTMLNTALRTFSPRALITMMESPVTCGYDPRLYSQIVALLNKPTTITILFMEGSTLAYYGWLRKADFAPLKEGEFPTTTVSIFPSNTDPLTGAEELFVFAEGSGTFNR
jgi:hypothetical protein